MSVVCRWLRKGNGTKSEGRKEEKRVGGDEYIWRRMHHHSSTMDQILPSIVRYTMRKRLPTAAGASIVDACMHGCGLWVVGCGLCGGLFAAPDVQQLQLDWCACMRVAVCAIWMGRLAEMGSWAGGTFS